MTPVITATAFFAEEIGFKAGLDEGPSAFEALRVNPLVVRLFQCSGDQ